jgi:hypothetical protein
MKLSVFFLGLTCYLLSGCSNPSPRQYFEQAALNCNPLYGFAGYELERDLGYVQERLADEKTMKMEPVTRAQVVKEKLARIEENYQKVKNLGSNKDADEMIKASTALYEFVLPVYKNEYAELAALYDTNAPADKIAATAKNITGKYAAKFEELYNTVIKTGTAFAERNGIPVKQVNPSPSN